VTKVLFQCRRVGVMTGVVDPILQS